MKDAKIIGGIILALIIIIYIIFLNECRRPMVLPCPPEGKMLIAQSSWDSLIAVSNKPPQIDTVFVTDSTHIPNPQPPLPQPKPDSIGINIYKDTLRQQDIYVWTTLKIKGVLLEREWQYRPITTVITQTKMIPVPFIIDKPVPVETPKNHLYFDIMYGTEFKEYWALPGLGLNFTSKKDFEIGYMFQRTQDKFYHSIKLGVRIF